MQNCLQSRRSTVGRRLALRLLAQAGAGIAIAGCTPVRLALNVYPKEFDFEAERVDRILRAFCCAVVPGTSTGDPDVSRVFYDEFYPLAKHRTFFAADLCDRAARETGSGRFESLALEERERIVGHALAEGGLITRLYSGAVFLTQIAILAGIYDSETGCPLIDFDGRFRPRRLADTTYPEPEQYLPLPTTADGNPA